jgi:hypothetical protein
MPIVVMAAKVALLVFLAGGVATIAATYYRRRRSGITPWRPPNSRILGYDAPVAEIVWPAPQRGVDEPACGDLVVRPGGDSQGT